MFVATMGVSRDLKIPIAKGVMDMTIGGAEDDVAAFRGVMSTVSMKKLGLVGRSSLGAIVKMGADFKGIRCGARGDGAA